MRKQFYIYVHCRPDGEPFHIGKGTGYRITDFTNRNTYHKRVVAKYGRKNILIYKLECESEQQAHAFEKWMIAYGRVQSWKLTNLSDGGEGNVGFKHSKNECAIRSKRLKGNKHGMGRRKFSADDDLIVSELFTDGMTQAEIAALFDVSKRPIQDALRRTGTKGVYINRSTPESNAKRSATMKGKPPSKQCLLASKSAECNAKRSAVLKGKPWSEKRLAAFNK